MPLGTSYKKFSCVIIKLMFMLFLAFSNTATAQQRAFDVNASLQNFPNMESLAACYVTTAQMEKLLRDKNMNEESQTAKIYKDTVGKIFNQYVQRGIGTIDEFERYFNIQFDNIQRLPFDQVLFAFGICGDKINQTVH